MTYQEIAKELGITHAGVMFIEKQALMKMRKRLMALGFDVDCL